MTVLSPRSVSALPSPSIGPGGLATTSRPWQLAAASLGAAAVARPMLPAVGPLCPLRRLTGVPCPACGASACAVALSRGDLGGAVVANPFVLLAFVAIALAACVPLARNATVAVVRAAGNRPFWLVPIVAVSWLWQLHRYDHI